jgi:tripartite-type tricarboxylate transporter receptor subunit TctC
MKVDNAVCLLALVFMALPSPATAQETAKNFPSRPVHIIVGNAAGGGIDILARLVGQRLSDRLGQPVIIENKPGASGVIAAQYVAKASPDGHTLLMAPIGTMTVNPAVIPNLPYDPQRDFLPVSVVASFPLVLAVNSAAPVRTVADLIAYAKGNPDKANAGASGVIFQVVQKLFEMRTGTSFQYISHRSNTETMVSLMRGDILMSLSDIGPVAGLLKDGRVRALAVTSSERLPAWPDVPTMAEAGIKDMEISFWSGLVAPAGTPQPIVKRLQDEVMAVMRMEDTRALLATYEINPEGSTSEAFGQRVAREIVLWGEVAKAGHIQVQQ